MIENKIYANEQPNQLTRYRNYRPNNSNLETLKNIKFGNFKSDFEEKVKSMLAIVDSI